MDILDQNFRYISLRQATYVVAAAEEGNVTKAAEKLSISQPAISAAIASLEKHYGQNIFIRLPGEGMALTSFGTAVIKEAKSLCDQAERLASLASPDAEISGEMSICCFAILAPYILPRLLRRFAKHFPQVSIRYIESDLEGVNEHLRRGTSDLVITYDLDLEYKLRKEVIYNLRPQVICSEESSFARRKVLRLKDLHNQRLILLDQPLSAQYVLGLLKAHKAEPIVAARVKGFEFLRALVANDFGVAILHTLPRSNVSYDGRRIISIPIADKLIEQRVVLAGLEQRHYRPVVEAIRKQIIDEFAAS